MDHDQVASPSPPAPTPTRPDPIDEPAIRAALEAALRSPSFASSDRLRRFLRFIVEETLAGRGDGLKEYVVATEVCDRPPDFDPRVDPVVRVEARRLRARLADYYAAEGREAPVVITVAKGGYVPAFERAATAAARAVGADADAALAPTPADPSGQAGPAPDSPRSPDALGRRMAWGAVAAALLVASLAAGWWWAWGRASAPTNGVAVLPFQNASVDPENEYFCFGLVEDLTAALTEVRGLRVVARTSAERFAGAADLHEVAEKLRVRYVVEGSVRREGPRLRVAARLVDARDGAPVWAQTYDRELRDVFAVQDELARAIAGALVPRLGLPEGPVRPRPAPRNAEALALYRKGQFLFRTQPGAHEQAASYLQEALAADPTFAPAHLELAAIHATTALDRISPPLREVTLARQGVERALALDPSLADTIALKAWIRFFSGWDWAGAERLFEDALAINPSSSVAHHRYALLLMTAGRFEEAIAHGRQALDLDPLSYRLVNGCAVISFCARRYPEAERLARESTLLAPRFFLAHLILGSTLVGQGRLEEGITAYRAALDVQPHEPDATASLGRALALAGRGAEARALLAALDAPEAPLPPSRYELAFLLAALGDHARALDELEASLARHETELVYLGVDPLFDPLRGQSRFEAVVRAVGVPRP